MSCQVTGNPPPSVQWSRGRQILKHGNKYKISSVGDEHFLEISNITLEDSGHYTCTLANPFGTISATCKISVGDTTPSHHQRSHQKIRSLRDHSVRYNGTDSESSDISTIDSELFLPHFAVKANTEPVNSTPTVLKRNSEPFHVAQPAFEVTVARQTSAPLNRNPVELNTSGANKHEETPHKKPVEKKEFSHSSKFIQSEKIKHTEVPKDQTKSPKPQIEKKGGVTQVDFRGVLKQKHSSKDSGVNDLNGHSVKLGNNTDSQRLDSGGSKVLSLKRQNFEHKTTKPVPNCVHIAKGHENQKSSKVNQALKKFENNTTSVQSDFRSVLKARKENTDIKDNYKDNKVDRPADTAVSQVDFRNVLKKKNTAKNETASESKVSNQKKVNADTRSDQLSDSSFEKKSIQKQRAELVVNVRRKSTDKSVPTPKLKREFDFTTKKTELEIPIKSEFGKSNKVGVDLSTVKPDKEPQLVEFRSVLTRPERQNSKESAVDIIKPVPRRLSHSKQYIMDSKPEVTQKLENQSVEYGSEVVLECHVTGCPEPELSWSINDKEIKQSKFFRMSYEEEKAKLVIAEAFSEDEGEYTCTATNQAGSAKTTCSLKVLERPCSPEMLEEPFSPTATPPKIYNICPAKFCILRGGTIEFKASYTSVPTGTVTWCQGKQELTSGGRMKIETSDCFSTLTIVNIQPEDSGRFDVKVENKLGFDSAFASLTVEDVPEAPVGKPWVSEVSLTAATLSWYGPAYDGGCPITNYRVEMCDAEDQEWTLVTSKCLSTTWRIENLQAHTPYFFRVFAENKHGLSEPCMTPEVTVTTDRRPSALLRLPSTESDDVFTHENTELLTPMSEYGIVSPLSPDEVSFEHREVTVLPNRVFENFYNCLEEVGKGKFGSVYKCEDKSTGKIWAAKVLKCRETEKKKIHLEVEIMNKLKHPKILMLWDVFEAPRKMILVMEYIGGGELFERVIDDDFELTERDCIQFMRQICDAVHYMHSRNILHLDLKPENILCIKNESNKIKIIDFGLARYYTKGESVRVLFGTPEFIAPEVVNYDEIGFTTDMWSIGVVCYVLLTGLSPFMGDTDAETLSNVTHGEFDFDEEEFDNVSNDGKDFIEKLLVKNKKRRLTSLQALEHPWLANDAARLKNHRINTKNLKKFMARRKWQKTGNAIRALGRMRNSLQKLMKPGNGTDDSVSSASGAGPSSSSSSLSSMGSQNTITDVINASNPLKVNTEDDNSLTNQNGGKFESTNQTQGFKTSQSNGRLYPVNEFQERNSGVKGHGVDINLNVTTDKKSAFVNSNQTGITVSTQSPAKLCQESKSDRSSMENGREDSGMEHLKFTKKMVDSKAFPGDVVRFDVAFTASKNTKVLWYFEDELLVLDEHHCVQESQGVCSLIIKDVCEDDDGEYICKISNNTHEESCSAELIVYGAL